MEPSSRRIHGMLTQIDPCSGFIKSVRTETIALIHGYFFLLGIAAFKALRSPGHFHSGSEYALLHLFLKKSQRKRIRGLTPQFDQRPHSQSKGTSHIDIRRSFKRNSKVAAMLAVLCSMSILRTSSSRFL
ncbi:hypothetical protein AVEN_88631-1 [Araneus ventricosus]|uniref:Uncharacterized protein n=1 Tax=Araneus ventricosus TaxID=182803 RepID=A0A4Y2KJC3_ARAVE|nr:hypothetical protein AVEN_88631-1 [Araneus ventricosus]